MKAEERAASIRQSTPRQRGTGPMLGHDEDQADNQELEENVRPGL